MQQLGEPGDPSRTAMHARFPGINSPREGFSVPRFNIPAGPSPSGFALRTAGLFAA